MKDNLIIIGSAPGAMDDYFKANDLIKNKNYDAMAIGLDSIDQFPYLFKYVATNHVEDIPAIRKKVNSTIISYKQHAGVDIVQPLGEISGSSSLLGALAGITLGYKKIILCGCPLEGLAPEGNSYEAFRPGWIAEKDRVIGKVKSMSGWTREFLGAPEVPTVTIGACWDGRDYYPAEYVNILYNSVVRHTSVPFDFVLYIGPEAETKRDLINPKVQVVQVGLPYWWPAMNFWRKDPPGVKTDTILYLDLDQVIVGSIDDLINFSSDHACMKDYPSFLCPVGCEDDACVAVTLIRNGAGAQVWDEYVKAGMPRWDPLDPHCAKPLRMAAQGIIKDCKIKKDLFPGNWVCSYRLQVQKNSMPEDCRIVSFHGRPKPHECLDVAWIRENWQ